MVLGCLDIIRTNGKLRVNLHIKVYERGKWPYFKPDYLVDEFTVQITGALLDRLTHHVHILEMNGESYRLKDSKRRRSGKARS